MISDGIGIEGIVVHKRERLLIASMSAGREFRFPVTLGRNWAADKMIEGDEATPLGEFYVCAKNPKSKFFLSMCLSYPNAEDAERGLAAKLITRAEHDAILDAIRRGTIPPQKTRLGGEIYIHGEEPAPWTTADGKSGSRGTRGCIALENRAMQELYERTELGTPVVITR